MGTLPRATRRVIRVALRGSGYIPAMDIRPAEPRDLAALTRIYNHYVATLHVTFDAWFEKSLR
jgi:hypothetical protein